MEPKSVPNRRAGGLARSASLTAEQKQESARRAASARWAHEKGIPKSTHEGEIKVGPVTVPCAVLEDGTRLLTQQGFLLALGRSERPKAGQGVTLDEVIPFLAASNLKPFITNELRDSTKPVLFVSTTGRTAFGFRAELLPQVCEVYLEARDNDALHHTQHEVASRADILVRGLARVGIIALIDEATGYQEVRDKIALAKILETYLLKEGHRKWERTFPLEYYRQMFRLKGWDFSENTTARPGVIGRYTDDIVYSRIKPGILSKLREVNGKDEVTGRCKRRHHQYFTGDVGVPELKEHLSNVIFLMKASPNWEDFKQKLDMAATKYGDTIPLALEDERKAKTKSKPKDG